MALSEAIGMDDVRRGGAGRILEVGIVGHRRRAWTVFKSQISSTSEEGSSVKQQYLWPSWLSPHTEKFRADVPAKSSTANATVRVVPNGALPQDWVPQMRVPPATAHREWHVTP